MGSSPKERRRRYNQFAGEDDEFAWKNNEFAAGRREFFVGCNEFAEGDIEFWGVFVHRCYQRTNSIPAPAPLPTSELGRRCSAQGSRGIDQRHVREGLREIAEHSFRTRIVFLGQQADIISQRHEPLE